ncbi:hypothetical protein BC835DRAFT_1378235 [Cytidiella melzeri]|nr:hypothetical protein BC835DRAFT_1378235 [Cytidiella melzeri]
MYLGSNSLTVRLLFLVAGMSILIPPIPYPLTLPQVVQALQDIRTTRYMGVVGLVLLMYDHALTFGDEVSLVWAAPRSFAKYAYLFNRYMVLVCLLAIAHEMCGFVGDVYSDLSCRKFLFVVSILSLLSIAIGNVLVLLRVVLLWDHRPTIFRLLAGGFLVSFSVQATLMVISLLEMFSGLYWVSTPINMCITTFTPRKFIGVWASPMLFEVLVLFSTILNALDRPHQAHTRVADSLYRDGITYFCAVAFCRTLNLIFATIGRPSTSMLMVFFTWSATTTVLSRSLLNIRKQEMHSDEYTPSGRSSPFNSLSARTTEPAGVDHETPAAWVHLATMRTLSR